MNEWVKEWKCWYIFWYIKQIEMKEYLSCQWCLWTLFHEASKKGLRVRGQQSGLQAGLNPMCIPLLDAHKGDVSPVSAQGYPRLSPRRRRMDHSHCSSTTMLMKHHPRSLNIPDLAPKPEHPRKPKQCCLPSRSGFMGLSATFWKYHLKQLSSLLSTHLSIARLLNLTLKWWKLRRTAVFSGISFIHVNLDLTISQQSQGKWYSERLKINRC